MVNYILISLEYVNDNFHSCTVHIGIIIII